jgi:hypothetical protein
MYEDSFELNPLWIYCRDSVTDDIDLSELIDANIEKINFLTGRTGDVKIPPLTAILVSKKSISRKYNDIKLLLEKGAQVNCLDEWGQSSLGYLLVNDSRAEAHSDIIDILRFHGGVVVRGHNTQFCFDLFME